MLEKIGTKVSISTVKKSYIDNLKGRSARKKPLLQNRHKKAKLLFADEDEDHTFLEKCPLGLMKQK